MFKLKSKGVCSPNLKTNIFYRLRGFLVPIFKLDSVTVNKIAAGEVVERPLSVVKELVENSLDAGASHIRVNLEKGGIDLIQVSDNGSGMPKEDLPLSVEPHATSKIKGFDDIYDIYSFGFRGEALASIAHIADVRIESKYKASKQAYSIMANPDTVSTPEPCALHEGTCICVEQLFSYVPVRKKQLKSPATETANTLRYVSQLAFWYPEVDFELVADGEMRFSSVGIKKRDQLCLKQFGLELKDFLIDIPKVPIAAGLEGVFIEGMVTSPTKTFPNRQKQCFAVNGRPTNHAVFRVAINQVFGPLIPAGRHPLVYLNLILPAQDVDVNIHPRKLEVALHNQALIYKFLPGSLRAQLSSGFVQESDVSQVISNHNFVSSKPSLQADQFGLESCVDEPDSVKPFVTNKPERVLEDEYQVKHSFSAREPFLKPKLTEKAFLSESLTDTIPKALFDPKQLGSEKAFSYLQVFNTYIVLSSPQGLWILDQHAVHEKILYETFCDVLSQQKATQSVMSCVVDLNASQAQLLEEKIDQFKSLGLDFLSLPSYQVQITQIPVVLYGVDISTWLVTLLDELLDQPEKHIVLPKQKEALQMKACKAAIKAGKVLREPEVRQLISDFLKTPERFTCPHGRPLYQHFSKEKLERLFLRA